MDEPSIDRERDYHGLDSTEKNDSQAKGWDKHMTITIDERRSEHPDADTIWHGTSLASGSFVSTAAPYWELVITDDGLVDPTVTLRGPETRSARLSYADRGEWWGIRFPIGSHPARLAMARLVNASISWPISADGHVAILGATCHITDHNAADALVQHLTRLGVVIQAPEVAAVWRGTSAKVPSRTLQRRFLVATGLSQQTARQIHRARTALDLLRTGTTILDTVAQLGYSDQALLTRSLKRWTGQTPASVTQKRLAAILA